jgi:membrane-associated phospholipid phosphatase
MKLKAVLLLLLISLKTFAQPSEVKWLSSIYRGSSAGKDNLAKGFSASVAPLSFAVPAAIFIRGLVKKDSALTDKGIRASMALAFNAIVSAGLKYYADRSRPYVIYPDLFKAKEKTGVYSFPSSHTSFAFATAASLTLGFRKWYVSVPAYLWAAGAGWSRMRLGVHYPTDVLAGALIGTASSFLTFKLDKLINRKPR